MTTNGAAAAWTRHKLIAQAAFLMVTGAALTGCGTSTNLLSNNEAAKPAAVAQAPTPPPVAVQPQRKIALAPVIGAPDTVSKPLTSQMATAMTTHRVPVAQNGEKSDWTLRGYVVAAGEKTGTKVSYIWDVTDTAGKRVNRITGEEMVAGAAKDPWSAVSPPLMNKIADHTAKSLAAWLPTQGGPPGPAIAQAPSAAGGPVASAAAAPAATRVAAAPAVAATTTGSLGTNAVTTVIVPVSGAPGDGTQSLTAAIQRELQRSGVAVGGSGGPNSYRVEGKVAVGSGKDGKQPVQIDWEVKDPKGKRVGTVSQKNEIPQGSLDGAWGQTADAAAAAAAQGIVKLLPRTSTN